jgi:3-oxoacyl-[acyl-carrier protein] reductase
MTKLNGKTAIVTGGGRDIGRAVSETLASQGANVVINYCNDEAGAQATLDAILSAGGKAILVKAMLSCWSPGHSRHLARRSIYSSMSLEGW